MSETFVVANEPGGFATLCLRPGCFDMDRVLEIGTYPTRAAAEAAARLHRKADKADDDAQAARLAHACPTCWRPL